MKNNKVTWFVRLIETPIGTFILFILLALNYCSFMATYDIGTRIFTGIRLFNALLFSIITTWCIRSSLKYGFIKTIGFIVIIPVALVSVVMNLFYKQGHKKISIHNVLPWSNFVRFDLIVQDAINEEYSCIIDECNIQKEGYYVNVKIPYGIHPPYDQIKKVIAEKLHIPNELIIKSEFSPTKIYFYFSLEALKAYSRYESRKYSWSTWKGFVRRIMLRE